MEDSTRLVWLVTRIQKHIAGLEPSRTSNGRVFEGKFELDGVRFSGFFNTRDASFLIEVVRINQTTFKRVASAGLYDERGHKRTREEGSAREIVTEPYKGPITVPSSPEGISIPL